MRFVLPWLLVLGCKDKDKDGPQGDDDDTTDTGTPVVWECTLDGQGVGCDGPPSAAQIGCQADFDALASLPLDSSISGARSVKTVLDQLSDDELFFQNSVRYPIHWDFAFNNLNAQQGYPPVPDLTSFNGTEYYSPDRRFILGAVVYYEAPQVWTYEIAPYDTASADMVAKAFHAIRDNAFFGKELFFHPASAAHDLNVVPNLPDDVPVVTTDELFAGVEYQPYNLGETTGLLTFRTAAEVDGAYTPYRELVVLDAVPNDISIVAGIVTGEFQTPLAHINVLSINRGTPNMGLKDAQQHPDLVALEGKWVRLTVEPFAWTIEEITLAEADAWWEEHRPEPLGVPGMDLTVTDLRDVEDIVVDGNDLAAEIAYGLTTFGSKGTNYAALFDIGQDEVPIQDAFVIPFYWYDKHMRDNGLLDELIAMRAEPDWDDPEYRAVRLTDLMTLMVNAPLDNDFLSQVLAKGNAKFGAGSKMRFRSSTNAEDLGTFTGAGLYQSQTGDPTIPGVGEDTVSWAIKTAWSTLWLPRAYEERDYYGIDQLGVGMALLTTPNFEEEEANGVAITNNIFDTSGLEPGFYVNVQIDDNEVVQPEEGVLPDAYIHYFYTAGEPVVYVSHSNLIPPGNTVLSNVQIHDLGVALDAIHKFFLPVYGLDGDWYGMDTEFKFDDKLVLGQEPELFMKQARPFPWVPGETLSACPEE